MAKSKKKIHIKPTSKRYSLKTRVRGFDSHRWRVPAPMKFIENRPKYHGLDSGLYGTEKKWDGTRVILLKSGDQTKIYGASSLHNDYSPRYPMILREGSRLRAQELILDCELVFFDKRTGNDIFVTALARPETISQYDIKLKCFDILFYDAEGKSVQERSYTERKKLLKSIIPSGLKHIEYVWWRKDRQRLLYDEFVAGGGEGVIIKNKRSKYHEGTRSPEWRKIKADDIDDAFVVGWTDGTGARADTFGALTTAQYKDGRIKFTGNVGGGFDNPMLQEIRGMLDSLRQEPVSPFNMPDRRDAGRGVHWVEPKMVIEIKFKMKTPSGKFRMPSFIRIRDDKTPEECIYNPTNV